jgi:coiled-coil domain-containing protein 12
MAKVDDDVKEIIGGAEGKVKGIVEDSKNTTLGDNLDVSIIAPRKVDWDLQRGIQDKLDKLERRTNRAVNALIRKLACFKYTQYLNF